MFRRKDEDVAHDLLSDAENQNQTPKNTPKSEEAVTEKPMDTATADNQAASKNTQAPASSSATPAAPSGGGYVRPDSSARSNAAPNRPASFRPNNDYNRNRNSSATPSGSTSNNDSNSSTSSKPTGRRVLTVGNDILLKGEIATCDRLVIEGAVDATLNEVHTVEIAQNGSFKGNAEIEDAEISGLFEGDLVVRNRLVIYSTGKVRGKITYGEIEIERGGEMTGEIRSFTDAKNDGKTKSDKKAA